MPTIRIRRRGVHDTLSPESAQSADPGSPVDIIGTGRELQRAIDKTVDSPKVQRAAINEAKGALSTFEVFQAEQGAAESEIDPGEVMTPEGVAKSRERALQSFDAWAESARENLSAPARQIFDANLQGLRSRAESTAIKQIDQLHDAGIQEAVTFRKASELRGVRDLGVARALANDYQADHPEDPVGAEAHRLNLYTASIIRTLDENPVAAATQLGEVAEDLSPETALELRARVGRRLRQRYSVDTLTALVDQEPPPDAVSLSDWVDEQKSTVEVGLEELQSEAIQDALGQSETASALARFESVLDGMDQKQAEYSFLEDVLASDESLENILRVPQYAASMDQVIAHDAEFRAALNSGNTPALAKRTIQIARRFGGLPPSIDSLLSSYLRAPETAGVAAQVYGRLLDAGIDLNWLATGKQSELNRTGKFDQLRLTWRSMQHGIPFAESWERIAQELQPARTTAERTLEKGRGKLLEEELTVFEEQFEGQIPDLAKEGYITSLTAALDRGDGLDGARRQAQFDFDRNFSLVEYDDVEQYMYRPPWHAGLQGFRSTDSVRREMGSQFEKDGIDFKGTTGLKYIYMEDPETGEPFWYLMEKETPGGQDSLIHKPSGEVYKLQIRYKGSVEEARDRTRLLIYRLGFDLDRAEQLKARGLGSEADKVFDRIRQTEAEIKALEERIPEEKPIPRPIPTAPIVNRPKA